MLKIPRDVTIIIIIILQISSVYRHNSYKIAFFDGIDFLLIKTIYILFTKKKVFIKPNYILHGIMESNLM